MKRKDKTSNLFDKGLGLLSIVAFSVILLDAIFNLSWLTNNIGNILIFGAGILFLIEGKAMKVFDTLKNLGKKKVDRKIIPKIFVVLVGLVAVIVGGLALLGMSNAFINTIQGGLSLSAIIIIALEIWVIN